VRYHAVTLNGADGICLSGKRKTMHPCQSQTVWKARKPRWPVPAAAVLLAHSASDARAQTVRVEVLSKQLDQAWGLNFIDKGRMLVTEKAGAMRLIQADGSMGASLAGLPRVDAGGQGGLLDVLADAGKNHGWPVITYGENYGGGPIGAGLTENAGMEQPLHYWTPSIAPSGMAFLRSDRYGSAWQGSLFVGSLKFRYLDRLDIRDGRVVKEEKLLQDVGQRIRDVREGPDGLLYVLTDASPGQLLRLVPES
jgi:glucose/arabinose dehydrogenase